MPVYFSCRSVAILHRTCHLNRGNNTIIVYKQIQPIYDTAQSTKTLKNETKREQKQK